MSPESLQRLQYLEHLIGRGEFTLAQIAQELDCSERTVRRLIRVLRAVGGDYVVSKTVWHGAEDQEWTDFVSEQTQPAKFSPKLRSLFGDDHE